MLKTGDKIKYVKENPMIGIPLETVFTITNIDGTVIALEGEIAFLGVLPMCSAKCIMSYDEYEKYFEKVIEPEVVEEPKPTWTEWRTVENSEIYKMLHSLDEEFYIVKYLKHFINMSHTTIETRNNGKKTDVRIHLHKYIKSTSTCNKAFDEFDEVTGIQVALLKLFPKILTYYSNTYIQSQY